MIRKNIIIIFALFYITIFQSNGQSLSHYGGYSNHNRWYKMKSDVVEVIYPEGLDSTAMRVVNMISHIAIERNRSIGDQHQPISIIINRDEGISNGYVSVFPYMSEFYATAPQDLNHLGSTSWMDQLTIHEYRHAMQYSNMKQHMVQIFSYLTGDYGWAGVSNAIFPKWFFEGDAIFTETALTEGGRGRLPYFFKEQRALCLDSIRYSYRKSEYGSLKEMVPNHYNLGYNMIREGRDIGGANVWNSILEESTKLSFSHLFYPFSSQTKAHIGYSTPDLYDRMMDRLENRWREQWKKMPQDKSQSWGNNKTKSGVISYEYPQSSDENRFFAVKSSYDKTAQIVELKTSLNPKEKKVVPIGISESNYITFNHNTFAWTEYDLHPLYNKMLKNRIIIYDIDKKKKKKIGKAGYYHSPEVSPDGKYIIAVERDNNLKYSLVLWDVEKNKKANTLIAPSKNFIAQPHWTKDGKKIVFITQKSQKIALIEYSLAKKATSVITPWTHHTISGITIGEDMVYFGASYSGIDQIYSVALDGKKHITQHTCDKVGAYYPTLTPDKDTLVYSRFTTSGYKLRKIALQDHRKDMKEDIYTSQTIGGKIVTNKQEHSIVDNQFDTSLTTERIKSPFYNFNPYAWNLYFDNNYIGGQVLMTGLFKEVYANVGMKYNTADRFAHFQGEVIYAKYPLRLKTRAELKENFVPREDKNSYEDHRWNIGASLPLSWYVGNYSLSANIEGDYTFHKVNLTGLDETLYPKSYQYYGAFSLLKRRARKNIHPSLGFYLSGRYQDIINEDNIEAWNIRSRAYLPSLFPNHGFIVDYGFQNKTPNYILDNYFNYSRGYSHHLQAITNTHKIGVDYYMPLLYPDMNILGIAYLKRVWGTLFYDHQQSSMDQYKQWIMEIQQANPTIRKETIYSEISYGSDIKTAIEDNQNTYFQRSVGAEIYFDINIFNSNLITTGFRGSYLFDPGTLHSSNLSCNFILIKNF